MCSGSRISDTVTGSMSFLFIAILCNVNKGTFLATTPPKTNRAMEQGSSVYFTLQTNGKSALIL
jgi:hypothetical protein